MKTQCRFWSLYYHQITNSLLPWATVPAPHSHSMLAQSVNTRHWGLALISLASSLQATGLALTHSIDFIQDHVAFAWKVPFPNWTYNFACSVLLFWWYNNWLRTPSPRPSRTSSPRRPWSRSTSSRSLSPSCRCPMGPHTPSPWPWGRQRGTVSKMDSMTSWHQRYEPRMSNFSIFIFNCTLPTILCHKWWYRFFCRFIVHYNF